MKDLCNVLKTIVMIAVLVVSCSTCKKADEPMGEDEAEFLSIEATVTDQWTDPSRVIHYATTLKLNFRVKTYVATRIVGDIYIDSSPYSFGAFATDAFDTNGQWINVSASLTHGWFEAGTHTVSGEAYLESTKNKFTFNTTFKTP